MDKMTERLKNYRIGVFAGGSSKEREISLKSGRAVYKALFGAGLNVEFFDVSEENFRKTIEEGKPEIVFIALHGRFGEDGTVQKFLDVQGIPYTGSAPEASLLALDKYLAKKKFSEEGLNVPDHIIVNDLSGIGSMEIQYPCVVKPRFEGSSIGLSIVDSEEKIERALAKALSCDKDVIVEQYIPGRELTVGVLDKKVLPVVEILPEAGVYDFTAKYDSKKTEYIVPADIPAEIYSKVQNAGLRAHKVLECRGFSRVDLRLNEESVVYVLEVNTIPGLTERSLLPMAAMAAGINFSELCIKMIIECIDNS